MDERESGQGASALRKKLSVEALLAALPTHTVARLRGGRGAAAIARGGGGGRVFLVRMAADNLEESA